MTINKDNVIEFIKKYKEYILKEVEDGKLDAINFWRLYCIHAQGPNDQILLEMLTEHAQTWSEGMGITVKKVNPWELALIEADIEARNLVKLIK